MAQFTISINITGVSQLASDLNLRGQAVEQAKNAAIDKVAQRLQETAQAYAEGGHPDFPERLTGTLQESLVWEHTGDGQAQVYTNLDYAYWVEFGHNQEPGRFVPDIGARLVQSFVPAYPFFRPAITQVIDGGEADQIIQETLQAAVENGDGGGGSSGGAFSSITAIPQDVAAVAEL